MNRQPKTDGTTPVRKPRSSWRLHTSNDTTPLAAGPCHTHTKNTTRTTRTPAPGAHRTCWRLRPYEAFRPKSVSSPVGRARLPPQETAGSPRCTWTNRRGGARRTAAPVRGARCRRRRQSSRAPTPGKPVHLMPRCASAGRVVRRMSGAGEGDVSRAPPGSAAAFQEVRGGKHARARRWHKTSSNLEEFQTTWRDLGQNQIRGDLYTDPPVYTTRAYRERRRIKPRVKTYRFSPGGELQTPTPAPGFWGGRSPRE